MSSLDIYIQFKKKSTSLILDNTITRQGTLSVKRIVAKNGITPFGGAIMQILKHLMPSCTTQLASTLCKSVLKDTIPICKCCDNFVNGEGRTYCSSKCRANDLDWQSNVSQIMLDKTGYSWVTKNPDTVSKSIETRKQTYVTQFGDSKSPYGFGTDFWKTCMLNIHGVENPSQVPEIFEKQQLHKNATKKYTFISGRTFNVQGYEPKALDVLIFLGYEEKDLLLCDRPAIKYFWSSEDGYGDDKYHMYHPDIIILSERRIIEVKSPWTYDEAEKYPQVNSRNTAKHDAAINLGWAHEFWIFD